MKRITKEQVDDLFDSYSFENTCRNIVRTSLIIFDKTRLYTTIQERDAFVAAIETLLSKNYGKRIMHQETMAKEYLFYSLYSDDGNTARIDCTSYITRATPTTELIIEDYDVIHSFVQQRSISFDVFEVEDRIIMYKSSLKNAFSKEEWKQMELF